MKSLLAGPTFVASFFGGVVALVASCCVSMAVPAFAAKSVQHRADIVPATLAFVAVLVLVGVLIVWTARWRHARAVPRDVLGGPIPPGARD